MNKKLGLLITFLVLVFGLFTFITIGAKNYTYEYALQKIKIKEEYNKEEKIYYYEIKTENETYEYALEHKYIRKRGLIDKVSKKDNCLTVKSEKLNNFSVCKSKDEYFTPYVDNTYEDAKVKEEYENLKIYNKLDYNYLIWNYNYFIAINDEETQEIELFNKDFYTLDLVTVYDHYLVVADYNEEYKFAKLHLINFKNFKTDVLELDRDIYFNSYILGSYKKYLYWYDIQEKKEYKIEMKDGTVHKNAYEVLKDGEFQRVATTKLDKKELFFEEDQKFEYILKDNTLYYKNPVSEVKVTKQKVSYIVMQEDKDAFFISEDSLYHVNLERGITKVMSNSEWAFNYKNIYVYNNK